MRGATTTILLVTLAATAACDRQPAASNALDALDANLADGVPTDDPAVHAALRDQIMVDPALTQQANHDAVRPPARPPGAAAPADQLTLGAAEHETLARTPAPTGKCDQCTAARQVLTLGALATQQGGSAGQCAQHVGYSTGWANRLPAGVALYPGVHVVEAAGADGHGCALRIVSIASGAPVQRILDWYYTHVRQAGYTLQHRADGGEHVLAGTRAAGGAFLLVARPRAGGGTEADLMVDGG